MGLVFIDVSHVSSIHSPSPFLLEVFLGFDFFFSRVRIKDLIVNCYGQINEDYASSEITDFGFQKLPKETTATFSR